MSVHIDHRDSPAHSEGLDAELLKLQPDQVSPGRNSDAPGLFRTNAHVHIYEQQEAVTHVVHME